MFLPLSRTSRLAKCNKQTNKQTNLYLFFMMSLQKWNVIGTHLKHPMEVILMSTHNICVYGETRKKCLDIKSYVTHRNFTL